MKTEKKLSSASREPSLLYEGVVEEENRGSRLDAFLASRAELQEYSRSRVQEWIRAGFALVQGEVVGKPNHKVNVGDKVCLSGQLKQTRAQAEEGQLDILHHDKDIVVLVKQPGVTVHPAPGVEQGTLVNFLLHRFPELQGMDEWRPGIVHRLDKDTSGLMVVALQEGARQVLQKDFSQRNVNKVYLALVHGVPPERGEIDAPVGRHPSIKTRMAVTPKGGRNALSHYVRLWADSTGQLSLVAVKIFTGRTHQIRVHMDHIGHPIVGDTVYGKGMQKKWALRHPLAARITRRQMLHASYLQFQHPGTGESMRFFSPPPMDFMRLPLLMRPGCQRVAVVGMPGSGKSYLSGLLAAQGVPVFSADKIVAELYAPGADCWKLLRGRFGDRFILHDSDPVDKQGLFKAMVKEPSLRREVMDMVHPLVEHRLRSFWENCFDQRLAVAEVPLFLEGGWREKQLADLVICVDMPGATRRDLLEGKRGVSEDMAAVLDSWQWSREDKRSASDIVVENSGDPDQMYAKAKDLLRSLQQRRIRQARQLGERFRELCSCRQLPFVRETGGI
ncbi:MAG: dephospho-CoA kinase [Desulfovibrio sp.]|uniref:dephospho-CoA kinase n=1 Tax=Desulfovibrio sp. 7SRBS1 TaxID=3378064 RepID=UPI003B3E0CB1